NEGLSSHLLAQVVAFPEIAGDAPLTFPALNIPGLPNAAGAGLAEALGAFAKDSSFAEFFAKHQSHYRPLKDASLASTVPIVAAFQNYTGSAAGPIKLFIAPLAQRSFVANCEETGTLVLFVGDDGSGTARMLARTLAHRAVGANGCGPAVRRDCRSTTNRLAIVQDQIARQLAVRALQADADPGKRTVKGPALAVTIGEGLKTYELNRRYFPTFRDFQPILLQSIASSDRPGRAGPRSAAAKLKLPVSLRSSSGPADPVCDALRRSSQT
ncbi:MAG TPA: hypothetical protein VGB39_03990, partial [Sphingomicrobium sp.]